MKSKSWRRTKPQKGDVFYHRLWRIVDGAVADALMAHPEYLSVSGQHVARQSIVKRVTGAITGFAEQSARGGPVDNPAPDKERTSLAGSASHGDG